MGEARVLQLWHRLRFANWAHEVEAQEEELGVFFDTIIVCSVTDSTQAGMVAGEVAAVLGTHDPTARCHLLPGGTAFVSEVGMTGRLGWTGGGFVPVHFAATMRGEYLSALPPYELASGPMVLGAVLVSTEEGRASSTERVA